MPTAATTNPTKAMMNLRALISKSATWQTWTGNPANEAAALLRVHPFAYKPPSNAETHTKATLQANYPICVIGRPRGSGVSWNKHDDLWTSHAVTGLLVTHFEDEIATGDIGNHLEAFTKFENNFFTVLEECRVLMQTAGNFVADSIILEESPGLPPEYEEVEAGSHIAATLLWAWGGPGG